MAPGSVLVPLQLERAEEDAALLEYSARTSRGVVYLHCTGPAASNPPTAATLDMLTRCLEPAAHAMPRRDVVPLLPVLGWTAEAVAQQLADVEEVVAAAEHAGECYALVDTINEARQRAGLPSVSLTLTAGHVAGAAAQQGAERQQDGQQQRQQEQQQQGQGAAPGGGNTAGAPPRQLSRVIGGGPSPTLRFSKVAVGGTFDRLHAGHRLLLAATALVTADGGGIYVGVTADQLLAGKRNRALLEGYDARAAAAAAYLRAVNPGALVVPGPLTDPAEPPLCAVDPEFDALVVSEETVPGALAINQTRAKQGFAPLTVVVVGLIYSQHSAAKLSSTDLREADAAGSQAPQ